MRSFLILLAVLVSTVLAVPIQDEFKTDEASLKHDASVKKGVPIEGKAESHASPEMSDKRDKIFGKNGTDATNPVNGTAAIETRHETNATVEGNPTTAGCGITDLDRIQQKVTEALEKQIELLLSGRPPMRPKRTVLESAAGSAVSPLGTVKTASLTKADTLPVTIEGPILTNAHQSPGDNGKIIPQEGNADVVVLAPSQAPASIGNEASFPVDTVNEVPWTLPTDDGQELSFQNVKVVGDKAIVTAANDKGHGSGLPEASAKGDQISIAAVSSSRVKRGFTLLADGQLVVNEEDDDGSYKPDLPRVVIRERIIRAPCISPRMDDNLRKMINETVAIAFADVKKVMKL